MSNQNNVISYIAYVVENDLQYHYSELCCKQNYVYLICLLEKPK